VQAFKFVRTVCLRIYRYFRTVNDVKQVCSSSYYSAGNVRWPFRLLYPGKSRSVFGARCIKVGKDGTDGRTDG